MLNKSEQINAQRLCTIKLRMDHTEDRGFNAQRLWKLKNKLSPKMINPTTSMVISEERLFTTEREVKLEAVKHYIKVLKERNIVKGLETYKKGRDNLSKEILDKAAKN